MLTRRMTISSSTEFHASVSKHSSSVCWNFLAKFESLAEVRWGAFSVCQASVPLQFPVGKSQTPTSSAVSHTASSTRNTWMEVTRSSFVLPASACCYAAASYFTLNGENPYRSFLHNSSQLSVIKSHCLGVLNEMTQHPRPRSDGLCCFCSFLSTKDPFPISYPPCHCNSENDNLTVTCKTMQFGMSKWFWTWSQ